MSRIQVSERMLAGSGARMISDAYDDVEKRFGELTGRAGRRFESRDWSGMAADAAERLDVYGTLAWKTAEAIAGFLGDRLYDKSIWVRMKDAYSALAMKRQNFELVETFFNSISRMTFATVGVDPTIEFVDTDFLTPPTKGRMAVFKKYKHRSSNVALIRSVLESTGFGSGFADLEGGVIRVVGEIESHLSTPGLDPTIDSADIARRTFYRGKSARPCIGRMRRLRSLLPTCNVG
jgi:isocitrate dehydrogenase kinase/phosphatase